MGTFKRFSAQTSNITVKDDKEKVNSLIVLYLLVSLLLLSHFYICWVYILLNTMVGIGGGGGGGGGGKDGGHLCERGREAGILLIK